MNKHAILILAHKNIEQLNILLSILDDKKFDIYIHIDKKCKEYSSIKQIYTCKFSQIFIFNEIDVKWGDYSIVEAEMLLLKEAALKNYSYYHLISGEDLPLKNNEYIYNFFENSKKEFVLFTAKEINAKLYDRVYYKHFFVTKYRGNKYKIIDKIFINLDSLMVFIQKKMHLIRKLTFKEIQKGSQWFSITNNFAHFIIKNESKIIYNFKDTLIPDELFIQTLLINSSFINNLSDKYNYNSCSQNSRYIDWNRGQPYTFKKDDFDDLINSNCCFARKFSLDIDRDIIHKIKSYLKTGKGD